MVFPAVDIYVVPVSNVLRWHREKLLGKNAKVSRSVFLDKLAPTILFPTE